ncbi:hypothetical protein [Streptomyces xanthii]|uniref:Uncharacterized protein n=1 Tax=Streptomyces xanthii TaxID=2768069 RepID=A0A7H1BB88_9ACTN|nr:hypothetical protein [Streptomyces xanthii]QNS05993.1 hypothetical protein IAG42_22015 [Streptomyces xanthii]
MIIDNAGELIGDWESVYQGYFPGDPDEVLRDTLNGLARARSTQPYDPATSAFYAFGLVWTYGYVASGDPDPELTRQVTTTLAALAVTDSPCAAHEAHPCDDGLDTHLEAFEPLLTLLIDLSDDYTWDDLAEATGTATDPESVWRCPHNVAGFARAAAEAIG